MRKTLSIQLLILFSLFPVSAPGVVSVSVSSITASSISLSWSVASGSVASWEVVWRETDRGTESSSGSLTGTSYTIDELESTTIYTVTVRASNAVGASSSQPITSSTGKHISFLTASSSCSLFLASDVCQPDSAPSTSNSDNTAGIIGGVVVAIVVILAGTVIVMFVLFLRSRRGSYSTSSKNR